MSDTENSIYCLQMILFGRESGGAMTPGQSVLVTAGGCENLSRSTLDLVING